MIDFFQFDIFGLNEGFQFTNYKAPQINMENILIDHQIWIVRKLSLSIQLTDPKEYEGWTIIYMKEKNKGEKMKKKQGGDLILFPSFICYMKLNQ